MTGIKETFQYTEDRLCVECKKKLITIGFNSVPNKVRVLEQYEARIWTVRTNMDNEKLPVLHLYENIRLAAADRVVFVEEPWTKLSKHDYICQECVDLMLETGELERPKYGE